MGVKAMDGVGLAIAAALILFFLGPIVTVVIWAFAEQWRYPNILPTQWGLRYWGVMLNRADGFDTLSASLSIAAVATSLGALICWPAAFAFARLSFPGSRLMFASFLAVQAFPKTALYVTIGVFFLRLNLVGTFWGVVLIELVGALLYMIWIPASAMRAVKPELEEAAFDLGASRIRVFLEVTLPQVAPALAASFVLSFVNILFEVEGALLIGSPTIRTMPILMLTLSTQIVVQYAAVMCVMLWVPSLALLLFTRRYMNARTIAPGMGA